MGAGKGRNRRASAQANGLGAKPAEGRAFELSFPLFEKEELALGNTYLYAKELAQPHSAEKGKRTPLVQQAVVFPIKYAGYPFGEHLIVTFDDSLEFADPKAGDQHSQWLSFQNAATNDQEDEVIFNKKGFEIALVAAASKEGRGWKRLASVYGDQYALVRAYEDGDQTQEPVVLLMSGDHHLDYGAIEKRGYSWKGVHGQDPVAAAFKLEDAKSLLELLGKMDENLAEFNALSVNREIEREKFWENPLKYRHGDIAPVVF